MPESMTSQTVQLSSPFLKWSRCVALLSLLLGAFWFAGFNARMIVAVWGIHYYENDIVEGGRLVLAIKLQPASGRLRDMSMSVSNYHDTWLAFPSNATPDSRGRALHSWMAHVLPFSWQGGASQFIDYSKPWDDAANRNAFTRRIRDYESPFRNLPRHNAEGYALAHIAGNVRVFGSSGVQSQSDFKDGQSNTLLAGDAAGKYAPWGQPGVDRDPALGINMSAAGFGGPWASSGAMMVFADGHVRMLSDKTSVDVLKALATPAGGELPPADY